MQILKRSNGLLKMETIDAKIGVSMLKQQFSHSNISDLYFDRRRYLVSKDYVKQTIKQNIHDEYFMKWHNDLERNISRTGFGGNKLRTYRTFKHDYGIETYVSRSAYAKFRCGVVPIRLETVRYERLSIDQRTCFHCTQSVETDEHVLFVCPLYDDVRHRLLSSIFEEFPYFDTLSNDQKLSVILSCDSVEILSLSAKTRYEILMRRKLLLYN